MSVSIVCVPANRARAAMLAARSSQAHAQLSRSAVSMQGPDVCCAMLQLHALLRFAARAKCRQQQTIKPLLYLTNDQVTESAAGLFAAI